MDVGGEKCSALVPKTKDANLWIFGEKRCAEFIKKEHVQHVKAHPSKKGRFSKSF